MALNEPTSNSHGSPDTSHSAAKGNPRDPAGRRRQLGLFLGATYGLCLALSACSSEDDDNLIKGTTSSTGGSGGAGGTGAILTGTGGSGNTGPVILGPPADPIPEELRCVEAAERAEPVPLDLIIMLDRSSSMQEMLEGSTETKWDAVTAAIIAFAGDLEARDLHIGLNFFTPIGVDVDDCNPADYETPEIAIAPLTADSAAQFSSVIASMSPPLSLTPTGPALAGAIEIAKRNTLATPGRETAVILATDGLPSKCDSPGGVEDIARAAANPPSVDGGTREPIIHTYVIGVGDIRSNMDNFAEAGGTIAATMIEEGNVGAQFIAALKNITAQPLSCSFNLPEVENPEDQRIDVGSAFVQYAPVNGDRIDVPPRAGPSDCFTGDGTGWYFVSPDDHSKLILCGESCNALNAGDLNIQFECENITTIQ